MQRDHVIQTLAACKQQPAARTLQVNVAGRAFRLVPLGRSAMARPEWIRLIADWRRENQHAFPAVFQVTFAGTQAWFQKRVVDDPERLLFGIFDADDCLVGHAGLASFDFATAECEIDNVMRGDPTAPPGLMTAVTDRLVAFAYQDLAAARVSLRVFGDNFRAVRLYRRCGFEPVESIPLACRFDDAGLTWIAQDGFSPGQTFRIFLRMRHGNRPQAA